MQIIEHEWIEVARSTGDLLAHNGVVTTEVMQSLNPYYPPGEVWQHEPTPPLFLSVRAVERLLTLVKDACGENASMGLRRRLDFRADCYPEGDCYINGLEYDLWLRIADLVLIRALEVQQRDPLRQYLTAAMVDRQYGLTPGTAKEACEDGYLTGTKFGRDLFIKKADAEVRYHKPHTSE